MKLSTRISIGILATLAGVSAYAVGPNDGIYQCTFKAATGGTATQYVTINSSSKTGSSGLPTVGVFAFPEIKSGQALSGFGIGAWSQGTNGAVLEGKTNAGGVFKAGFTTGGFEIALQIDVGGKFIDAVGTCPLIL